MAFMLPSLHEYFCSSGPPCSRRDMHLTRRDVLRVALVGLAVTLSGCAGVTRPGVGATGSGPEAGCPTITTRFGHPSRIPDMQPWNNPHSGLDFNVPVGTPVFAAAPGVVMQFLYHSLSPRGVINMVVYHGQDVDGKHVFSLYAHLSEQKKKPRDRVERGEVIALSGNTGTRNGIPHLHLTLWRTAVGPGPDFPSFFNQAVARLDKEAVLADPAMYWADPRRPGFDPSKSYPERPIRLTYPLRCSKSD